MPVPTYDQFIEPILRYLAARPDGAPVREVYEAVATALELSDIDKQQLLPSKVQPVYKNRAGWAHDRLKRAGLSESLRRGFWRLTQDGRDFAAKRPALSPEEVEELATADTGVPLRNAESEDLESLRPMQPRPASSNVAL